MFIVKVNKNMSKFCQFFVVSMIQWEYSIYRSLVSLYINVFVDYITWGFSSAGHRPESLCDENSSDLQSTLFLEKYKGF